MTIKDGVKLKGIQPEMVLAAYIVDGVYEYRGWSSVITSAMDGKHSPNSLHYSGYALDFRTRHIHQDDIEDLFGLIKQRLGPNYDVVLEQDHLHVEFDPKK